VTEHETQIHRNRGGGANSAAGLIAVYHARQGEVTWVLDENGQREAAIVPAETAEFVLANLPLRHGRRRRNQVPVAGPEFVPEWDVFRDVGGTPVTITWQQVHAIWHAVRVVEQVRQAGGERLLWQPGGAATELAKSRLLGRMLVEGLPPTRTAPPRYLGGPAWHLLPGGDPFADQGGD
jgi:hypothetical protein